MATTALISIICADSTGLVAAIAGRLFGLGANLGDPPAGVLGGAAEFPTVAELPDGLSLQTVEAELRALPALDGATLTISPFSYRAEHGPAAHITHRIEVTGRGSPGLMPRPRAA